MSIDRAEILRQAEKLLRQGKVEPAIAEYLRIVQDHPRDWGTANTLGDLYVRSGQVDKGTEQFARIADSLNSEGFHGKASAVYKKILKLRPDDEHALLQSAEIAGRQGLLADARTHLAALIARRRSQGDTRGVAEVRLRLGALDPGDIGARTAAASARAELGDAAGAVEDLKQLARELTEKGREAEALEALRSAASLNPSAEDGRGNLLEAFVASGDFDRARECASNAGDFRRLAEALELKGHHYDALEALREADRLEPGDTELRARLARGFAARGDLARAAEYLTGESTDPQLLLEIAEIHLRGGKTEEGLAIVRQVLEREPWQQMPVALLAGAIAGQAPAAAFAVAELAANAALATEDWASAAAALQEFVARVPHHIPALLRLVEICVDGGFEATMYEAQAQLADAYLAAGMSAEARFIAEDLVVHEPWDRAHVARFRRALELVGESDPDQIIADCLSGESAFGDADLFPVTTSASLVEEPSIAAPELSAQEAAPDTPAPAPPLSERFAPGSNVSDMERFLIEAEAHLDPAPVVARSSSESVEVDLSIVLNDIERWMAVARELPAAEEPAATEAPAAAQAPDEDLESVFERLRGEAARRPSRSAADEEYKRALALREAGDIDGCIAGLQAASRAPELRFATGVMLGRIYRERAMLMQAIEWLERAAQAPAPTSEEAHGLLLELADALEAEGETARALAVCLELQAEAGLYRDVAVRIDRLTRVQAG